MIHLPARLINYFTESQGDWLQIIQQALVIFFWESVEEPVSNRLGVYRDHYFEYLSARARDEERRPAI